MLNLPLYIGISKSHGIINNIINIPTHKIALNSKQSDCVFEPISSNYPNTHWVAIVNSIVSPYSGYYNQDKIYNEQTN